MRAVLVVLFGLTAGSMWADSFNLAATERGFVCLGCGASGNNGASPINNYLAGFAFPSLQSRDWFEFSIPTLTGGSLVSATLELDEPIGGHNGGALTFSVYGLGAQPLVFSDVTTSNPFGSVGTSSSDNGTTVNITLNAAALAAITAAQGGTIFIGGIDSGENSSSGAYDFAFSIEKNTILSLTTAATAVPEPSSLPILGALGFAALIVGWRRRAI